MDDSTPYSTPYSTQLLDHCRHPRNVGSLPEDAVEVGTAWADATACQDVVKLQIRVDPETELIADARFKTFGCGPAIASSSLATEWLRGCSLVEALQISSAGLAGELALPPRRVGCADTVELAIKMAVDDYQQKQSVRKT